MAFKSAQADNKTVINGDLCPDAANQCSLWVRFVTFCDISLYFSRHSAQATYHPCWIPADRTSWLKPLHLQDSNDNPELGITNPSGGFACFQLGSERLII